MFTGEDVLELYAVLVQRKIEVWVDGGWGVDALLGRQSRPHDDLNIALKHSDIPELRKLLEAAERVLAAPRARGGLFDPNVYRSVLFDQR